MRLPSLRRMWCSGFPDHELIRGFILANSSNLEFLLVDYFELRFNRAVVFKNMTELECGSMDKVMVKSLPAIRRLTLQAETTVAVLDRLPAAQMLSLDLRFDFDSATHEVENDGGADENEGLDEFATVIARMSSLKELSIYDIRRRSPTKTQDPGQALSIMFNKLHHLEKVSIVTNYANFIHSGSNRDSIMLSLGQQNPNLRDVCFRGIDFTPAAFASLAQLRHVSHISLELFFMRTNVSTREIQLMTDNVLTLLKGSSRNVIRCLEIAKSDVDVDQVAREVELMSQERGTTFAKFGEFWISFKIHV